MAPTLQAPSSASPAAGDLRRLFLFTAFAILLAGGLVLVVGTVCASTLNRLIANSSNPQAYCAMGRQELGCYIAGGAMLVISAICVFIALREIAASKPISAETDSDKYDLYLVGIGYALVLLAILNFVAMAGFAYVGQLENVLHVDFASDSSLHATPISGHIHSVLFMLMMPGYAVLGALFFTANALRGKRETLLPAQAAVTSTIGATDTSECATVERSVENPQSGASPSTNPAVPKPDGTIARVEVAVTPREPFDKNRFWGGLWFRMGEGLVFTLVVFLVAIGSTSRATLGAYLLLASLLLGMFVKTGEGLIAGMADKFFAAVKAMVK